MANNLPPQTPSPSPDDGLQTMLQLRSAKSDDLGAILQRYDVRLRARIIAAGAYRDVDDVVQDAFLRIFAAIRDGVHWPTIGQFRAWVHLVARSVAVDHLRRQGRSPRHLDSLFAAADSSMGGAEGWLGNVASPSVHASAREMLEAQRQRHDERMDKISTLREPDQLLVAMWEVGQLSWRQIAEDLGQKTGAKLTEDQVRVRYRRLLDKVGEPVEGGGLDGLLPAFPGS